MVVKSATKKKLMDMGVDAEHAHALAWERKWDGVRVLSPRNLLTVIYGAKDWNMAGMPVPTLTSEYPIKTIGKYELTEMGKKHLDTINDYYKTFHNINEKNIVEQKGIINHEKLFTRPSYFFNFQEGNYTDPASGEKFAIKLWRYPLYLHQPHEKHRERQWKMNRIMVDKQGRMKQYSKSIHPSVPYR